MKQTTNREIYQLTSTKKTSFNREKALTDIYVYIYIYIYWHQLYIYIYIYTYVEMIDCSVSDSMVEICEKLDKSNF